MTKQLYVSSEIQRAIFNQIIRSELKNGFWKDHRPAGHGALWDDVEVVVSTDDFLGFKNFEPPRLYNLVNPDFIKPNADRLVNIAQSVKPSSNIKSVQKELIELSRIIGKRLTSKSMEPLKANRGTNKGGTVLEAKAAVTKAAAAVKRTVVKRKGPSIDTIITSSGVTVRRAPVTAATEE